MKPPIPSPCQQRCQLDATGEHCLSCRRSIKEIAGWPGFSDFEKKAVWNRLLALPPQVEAKQCQRCGDSFSCGANGPANSCWCAKLPNIMPLDEDGKDCLCPSCLLQAIARAGSDAAPDPG
ncbi:cysteine-rich CWC family protein [Aquitalea denitrificans]|uniref:cysteine-rich CWC family protein n=1 Tax=Aquitalea denitrificans TaxID=519081 RepID=UPI00135A8A01|nr:cysteine-rich CWC family protein [Aquitalea denitrificans]